MPAGLVEDDNGVGAGRNGRAYLAEMRLHGLGIGEGHGEGGALAEFRADGAEDVDPPRALVVRGTWPGAAMPPIGA